MYKTINIFNTALLINNIAAASDNDQDEDMSNILSRFSLSRRDEGATGNMSTVVMDRTDDLGARRETRTPLFNNEHRNIRCSLVKSSTDYVNSYISRFAPISFHDTEQTTTVTQGATGSSETTYRLQGAIPKNPTVKKKRRSNKKVVQTHDDRKEPQSKVPTSSMGMVCSSLANTFSDDEFHIPEVDQTLEIKQNSTSEATIWVFLRAFVQQSENDEYISLEDKKDNITEGLKNLTYEVLQHSADNLLKIINGLKRIAEKTNEKISVALRKARRIKRKYSVSRPDDCTYTRVVTKENFDELKQIFITMYDDHYDRHKTMLKVNEDLQLIEPDNEEIGKSRRKKVELIIKMYDKSLEICDNQLKKIAADEQHLLKLMAD